MSNRRVLYVTVRMAERRGDEDRRRVELRPSTSRDHTGRPEEPSDATAREDWPAPPPVQRAADCHLRRAAREAQTTEEQAASDRGQRDLQVALMPLEEEFHVVELPCCLAEQRRLAEQQRQAEQERLAEQARALQEEPRIECPDCGQRFGRRSTLMRHLRETHGDNQVKCPHCEATFTRRHSLGRHLDRQHPQ